MFYIIYRTALVVFMVQQGILPELHKTHDIIKLTVSSLVHCHQLAVTAAGTSGLDEDTLVDGRYTHKEFVIIHLKFLAFVLQEGVLYLHWHRARDIWDCLVANPDACEFDREVCTLHCVYVEELVQHWVGKILEMLHLCECTFGFHVHQPRLKKLG